MEERTKHVLEDCLVTAQMDLKVGISNTLSNHLQQAPRWKRGAMNTYKLALKVGFIYKGSTDKESVSDFFGSQGVHISHEEYTVIAKN